MSVTIRTAQKIHGGVLIQGSPDSVTAGLVQKLDARDYSGSGTTWTATVGNSVTLYNSPAWHNTGPGYFSFVPASRQYAEGTNQGDLGAWTIECWFKTTATLVGTSYPALITTVYNNNAGTQYGQINYVLSTYPDGYTLTGGYFNGAWHTANSGQDVTVGTWYQMAATFDGTTVKTYVNGVELNSVSGGGSSQANGGPLRIARRWDGDTSTGYFMPVDISLIRIYNRALAGADVLLNYNVEKGRFGL